MASSESEKPLLRPQKRVCRSRSPHVTRRRCSTPEPRRPSPPRPSSFIRGLKSRERVDKILADMFIHHSWSIKDFLWHMVTEGPLQPNAHSAATRARKLSDAIYGQSVVVEQLGKASNAIYTTGITNQVPRLQSELNGLINRDILGEFRSDVNPADIDIPGLAARVQDRAPELWALLVSIVTSPDSSQDRSTNSQGRILMICSILTSSLHPRKSTNFPMLLGLYLHSMGVKRRVLSLLAGLGIVPSYQTIMAKRKELADLGQVLSSQSLENI